jgi:hypothetical protein
MNQSHNNTPLFIICGLAITALSAGCTSKEIDDPVVSDTGTIVVNLANDDYDEYIGRGIEYHTHMLAAGITPGEEGWLGHPHPFGWCDRCLEYHTRPGCIDAFKKDFYQKVEADSAFRAQVISLNGKRLGCYCKPEACHGDVIKAWLEGPNET